MITSATDDKEQSNDSGNTQQHHNEKTITPYTQKRGGSCDHAERSSIKNIARNADKVMKILTIHKAVQDEEITMPMMTEPCRTFFKQVATPIQRCLQNHFANNFTAFLERYTKHGKFPHSKFCKMFIESLYPLSFLRLCYNQMTLF
jgi:hypothetical protein